MPLLLTATLLTVGPLLLYVVTRAQVALACGALLWFVWGWYFCVGMWI